MTLPAAELHRRVITNLADHGLPTVGTPIIGGQALELQLDAGGVPVRVRMYVRNITHGGRGRKDREYRIQLTGQPPTLDAGATTMLLGYFEPKDVYVAFDPGGHQQFGTSPSIQVSERTLERAESDGVVRVSRRRRQGVEEVVAFSGGYLADVVLQATRRANYVVSVPDRRIREALAPPRSPSDGWLKTTTASDTPRTAESPGGEERGLARTRINIRPGVGILALFPHMNYQPWFALAEFVDNALASYEDNRQRLEEVNGPGYQFRVVVDVDGSDGGLVRVWDNAAGIGPNDYDRAFVTAAPPPHVTGLSEFGIGMKSAACWFASRWRVTTKPIDEAFERVVEFDVPRIVRDNVDSLDAHARDATAKHPFTEIKLWDLHKPPLTRTVGKMREHLASIYRQFLDSGEMRLEFNGEVLKPHHPPVLNAPKWDDDGGAKVEWRESLDFYLPSGEHVTGFGALRETGSTKFAGFALLRHRRLVVGSADETYRPAEVFGASNTYPYQRLFGELNLDQFDVSHTKDGFIWGDREQPFLDALRRALDQDPLPLLQQAQRYRSRKADASVERAAGRALEATASAVTEAAPVVEKQVAEAPTAEPPPAVHPVQPAVAQRTLELTINGVGWHMVIDVTNDPAQTDWLQIADANTQDPVKGGQRSLGIRVSLASPFMRRFAGATADDIEPLLRVAAGIALAQTTAREAGVKQAGTILRNLNELLATALSKE
ncbi:hypothetical protein BH23CHL7_BH23CHL7_16010 [soil metagenome]